jgi:hypothetical protein
MHTTAAVSKCLAWVICAGAIAGCASKTAAPIDTAADTTVSYIAAKRDYVERLDRELQKEDPNSPYRLVAVVGPAWRIGTVIAVGSQLNVKTEACVFPAAKLPVSVPWSDFPGSKTSGKIDLGAGLPQRALKLFNKNSKASFSFSSSSSGEFALTEIESTILAQDTFEAGLSSTCRDGIPAKGALIVRGIVTAKEKFSSGNRIVGDAGVTIIGDDPLVTFKYNQQNDFELADKKSTPKMFMVAHFPGASRGHVPPPPRPPTADEISTLEGMSQQ